MSTAKIEINRAPVLTLWGAVVAERMGYDWDAAASFGGDPTDAFGGDDIVVAAFGGDLTHRWSAGYGTAGAENVSAVAAGNGSVTVGGSWLLDVAE